MINKNFYRKTNDKKILHKVGKQWKVVSVALLMAIAGGAVATHAANADETNTSANNSANVDELVQQLDNSAVANAPVIAQKPASTSAHSAAPSSVSASIQYYPGDNGSAAKFFDRTASDNAIAAKNKPTVDAYVQSLNNEYNPQVHSLATKSVSAQSAASNDSKLAKSYSVTAKKPNTENVLNSLANKAHMAPSIYQASVEANEQDYSNAVNSASADVKANKDVASLANKLEGTNLSAANLSASASSVVAHSNYIAASDNYQAVLTEFGSGDTTAASYVNIANQLRADIVGLDAAGNPVGNETQYGLLTGIGNGYAGYSTPDAESTLNSAITSAASDAVKTYAASYSAALNNPSSLSAFAASSANSSMVFANTYPAPLNKTDASTASEFNAAVSETANEGFANVLSSAANSLYGQYRPKYATSLENSTEASSAEASASDELDYAEYANSIASANYVIVNKVYSYVGNNSVDSKASAAYGLLQNGVTSLEASLGMVSVSSGNTKDNLTSVVGDVQAYETAMNNAASDSLASDLLAAGAEGNVSVGMTTTSVASNLSSVASFFDTTNTNSGMDFTQDSDTNTSDVSSFTGGKVGPSTSVVSTSVANVNNIINGAKNINPYAKSILENSNDAVLKQALSDSGSDLSTSTTMSDINGAMGIIKNKLNSLATHDTFGTADNDADAKNEGLEYTPSQNVSSIVTQPDYAADSDALLSDGIDMSQLESESDNIAHVAAAAQSANDNVKPNTTSNVALDNDLSAASSSADSASGSAETASDNYSAANDEDVTLANYFATSYASDASNENVAQSSASTALNNFFLAKAHDDTFANADAAYSNAVAAANNDYKLGVANAKAVYNSHAHFLDALKGARLHSTPNFGSDGDKVVGSVNKGDRLTVYGVNVSRNNNIHGVIRYYVLDNANGKKGFFTGQDGFSKAAYLTATSDHRGVEVKTLKPVRVYSDYNSKHAVATLPAGKVVENATVVYGNTETQDAYGFTKVETANGDFFTANTDYTAIVVPSANNNNVQSDYNFNLNNNNPKMGPYYNNTSED